MNLTAYEDPALAEKCALLRQALGGLLPTPGDYQLGVSGLTLYRREVTNRPHGEGCAVPHVAIVFQGAEQVRINGRDFHCGQCQCRMTSQDSFGSGHIVAASPELPFLAASLQLQPGLLQILARTVPAAGPKKLAAVSVETAGQEILDAFYRLVMLHDKPALIPRLAPPIVYEIHYLLVAGVRGLLQMEVRAAPA